MAPNTPPALMRAAVLVALALTLASCGGGSTANPIAATGDATTAPPPVASTTAPAASPTPAAATQTTATIPKPAPRTSAPHGQGSGGAARPEAAGRQSSSTPPTTTEQQAAPAPPPPAGSPLDETAHLTLVNRVSPAHYFQTGTVTGTYDGTMEVEARITSKGVIVAFTATLPGGTIAGRGIAVAILDSTTWPSLRGTAAVTGGTGRFAGIHGRRLKVTGRSKPDASKAHVRLAGTVGY